MHTSTRNHSMNFTRKVRLLLIVALATCAGLALTPEPVSQAAKTVSPASAKGADLRGQAAIDQLEKEGAYESLGAAMAAAQTLNPVLAHQARLTQPAGAMSDFFGAAVAVSGETAAIGAFFADGPATNQGAVYVFTRSNTVWTLQARLVANGGAANDNLGNAVALDGNMAVVGAYSATVNANGGQGAVANDANGVGLLFNPLPAPVRLLETRAGFAGCYAPNAPLLAGSTRQQQARGVCGNATITASALAIVGNATVINNQAGYLTFWPDGAAQPLVATSNFGVGQVLNRHFTVGLGATGNFNLFTSAQTDLIVDVSGFFAP